MNGKRTLVLASGSPRRHEILLTAGYPHIVRPTDADEEADRTRPPREVVETLSKLKAAAALRSAAGDEVLLTADTIVAFGHTILEKPRDADDAVRMLRALSGGRHSVFTSVTLCDRTQSVTATEESVVYFRPLTEDEIAAYVATGEPLDKAGAYGVQGRAGIFVERIEGDYWNVVGLPLCRTAVLLRERFGITPDYAPDGNRQ